MKYTTLSFKRLFSALLLLVILSISVYSQYSPNGLNYQAVARNNSGKELSNVKLTVQISILAENSNGTLEWKEEHQVKTNDFGLFTLTIGNGSKTGGSATSISSVNWGGSAHYLKVEIDFGDNQLIHMGTTQMLAVPYALYAEKAGNSNGGITNLEFDPLTNNLKSEGQVVTDLSPLKQKLEYDQENYHLSISGMPGIVDLRAFVHPPQDLRISNDKIWLTGNKDSTVVDLSTYKQSLSINSSGKLVISSGNYVSIDTSSVNEIQTLTRNGDKVKLSNNGGEVSINDGDADATNELITSLSYNSNTQKLSILEGSNTKTVDLAPKQVAFRTIKHINNSLNPGDKYTVKFLIKELDDLNVYDTGTGFFTVPIDGDGIYCFFINFDKLITLFDVELYVNDINPKQVFSYNQPLLTKLNAGDKVKIIVTSHATDLEILYKGSFIGYRIN